MAEVSDTVEQRSTQRTGPVIVSPVNGARMRALGPGQTANPRGSSEGRRYQAAINRMCRDKVKLKEIVENQAAIASSFAMGSASTGAAEWLAKRTIGPVGDGAAQQVVVKTELVFVDRRDGSKPSAPMRCMPAGEGPRVLSGPKSNGHAEIEE